tara:strand:- start:317 stop:994 length:678 start_codon:yes stop_codon:yes gene_type:complete
MPFIGVQPASALLTSADIQDGQITTAKIADTAVTTAKITDDAVTGSKIENSPTIANGLTLTDGDVTLASGHGLAFTATGDGSGTDSSELFDDYEEGSWTPTILGSSGDPTITYDTLRLGYYTKIGRHVFVIGRLRTDGAHSGGGDVQLSGLPYTESGIDGNNYTSGGGVVSDSFGSNPPHSTMVVSNTNYFLLIYGNYNALQVSHLSNQANANQIQFSLHYMTDA